MRAPTAGAGRKRRLDAGAASAPVSGERRVAAAPPSSSPWRADASDVDDPIAASLSPGDPPPDDGASDAGGADDGPLDAADDVEVVISACVGRQGRVGIAYVDLEEPQRVLRVTDVLDPDLTQLHRLKEALVGGSRGSRRGLCVLPARSPPEMFTQASAPVGAGTNGDGQVAPAEPFPIVAAKAIDFDFEPCRQRLLFLRCRGEDLQDLTPMQRELRGQAVLDLGNEQIVRAAGGLLRLLEKNRARFSDIGGGERPSHVHDVCLFSLDSMLFVDSQTMGALQVFSDGRPCRRLGGGANAERRPVSVHGLLEPFVASGVGKAVLRRWLQQPSRDLELLLGRHSAVEELVRPRHAELLRALHAELKEMRDVSAILRRIFGCYHFDNPQDWRALAVTLERMGAALEILRVDAPSAVRAPLAGDLRGLVADVTTAEDMLQHFVDLDAAAGQPGSSEVRIRSGVDDRLDALREQYETIDEYLAEVADMESRRLGRAGVPDAIVAAVAFHYFPQLGFHASLPNPLAETGADEDPRAMEELKRGANAPSPDWNYQFAGGGRLFYKCPLAERLDAEVGDLVVAARDVEVELLAGVTERMRRLEQRLCRSASLLAELDVLAAFATAAAQFGWCRPRFTADIGRLRIVKGRHPLVDSFVATHHGFVPNDTDLGGDGAEGDPRCNAPGSSVRVQVVTGANLSGKSVYLKQVGIIVVMAQVGSFVPAESAELGLCDLVFSRIRGVDRATARCSSFGADLAQVAHALRHATPASLLLLDEFGKGTHAADGIGLFGATVEYLRKWDPGPMAILTTHFTEVFRFGLVSECQPGLLVSNMRVLPPSKGGDGVAYLHQLVPGVSQHSLGLECARRAGFDAATLRRAAEILDVLEGEGDPDGGGGDSEQRRAAGGPHLSPGEQERQNLLRSVVGRLCATDPGDEAAIRALLDFVTAHRDRLFPGGGDGGGEPGR